jgi:hypothetical protein
MLLSTPAIWGFRLREAVNMGDEAHQIGTLQLS